MVTRTEQPVGDADREEGYYWVRWRAAKVWDVMFWADGVFWDHGDEGYSSDDLTIGHRVHPPAAMEVWSDAD